MRLFAVGMPLGSRKLASVLGPPNAGAFWRKVWALFVRAAKVEAATGAEVLHR
jgi:hypothetical protein